MSNDIFKRLLLNAARLDAAIVAGHKFTAAALRGEAASLESDLLKSDLAELASTGGR